MPLHDHFHPPWSIQRPWEGFHSAWATAMAFHLNSGLLPADYFAMPSLEVSGRVEVAFEVQVLQNFGGPQLRAAIELVSPSNKDRPSARQAFAAKCAGYLRRGVSVIAIDIVTERLANLHADILKAFDRSQVQTWESSTHLYAIAYRAVLAGGASRLEVWPEELTVGKPLPEMPIWLEPKLCIQLRLEESYAVTCSSLRMRG